MHTPNGTPGSVMGDPLSLTVLLVEETRDEVERARTVLASRVPNVQVLNAAGIGAARTVVQRAPVDLIVTRHRLSDGSCADVLGLAAKGPESVPVVAYVVDSEEDVDALRQRHPDLLDCQIACPDGSHLLRVAAQYLLAVARAKRKLALEAGAAPHDLLRRVRRTISRVNHDLNNPLSIISGNAQLLVELSRVMDLDDDLCMAIRDIEEASGRVQGILRRLLDLRDQLPAVGEEHEDLRAELRELAHERSYE